MTRRIFLAVFLTALTVMLGSSVAAFFVFGYQAEVQYELSLEEVSESLRLAWKAWEVRISCNCLLIMKSA